MISWWNTIEENSGTVANLATILSLVGLFLVFKQLRQADRVNMGANTMDIIKYLQSDNIRAARYYCIENLKDKPVSKYNKSDNDNASLVCSSYDLAGIYLQNGYASTQVIADSWGPSISETHKTLQGYIAERRRVSGERFWDDFDWLADKARSFHSQNINMD